MYNLALCYRSGEGTVQNYREARHWMKCAAMAGHRKAQFEHGLTLFAVGSRTQLQLLEPILWSL
jgi:TPR repeat protein